jgi:hypothetical protein
MNNKKGQWNIASAIICFVCGLLVLFGGGYIIATIDFVGVIVNLWCVWKLRHLTNR